jgi:hypothetical protein
MQMAGTIYRAVSRKECQTSAEMFVVESILLSLTTSKPTFHVQPIQKKHLLA